MNAVIIMAGHDTVPVGQIRSKTKKKGSRHEWSVFDFAIACPKTDNTNRLVANNQFTISRFRLADVLLIAGKGGTCHSFAI